MILLCGIAFVPGCAERPLKGDWICVDASLAPLNLARLNFLDEKSVSLSDGTNGTYWLPSANVVEIKFQSGEVRRFDFSRSGENLVLADSMHRYRYLLQQ